MIPVQFDAPHERAFAHWWEPVTRSPNSPNSPNRGDSQGGPGQSGGPRTVRGAQDSQGDPGQAGGPGTVQGGP